VDVYVYRRAALKQGIISGILEDGRYAGVVVDCLVVLDISGLRIIRAVVAVGPDITGRHDRKRTAA
jgi:hypothetical protein